MNHPPRRSCALSVIVPAGSPDIPDVAGIVNACRHRFDEVIVVAWADSHDPDLDLGTVERCATAVDLIETLTHVRPDYSEITGDLAEACGDLVSGVDSLVLALPVDVPKRSLAAVRRAAHQHAAHLALVPAATPTARLVTDR